MAQSPHSLLNEKLVQTVHLAVQELVQTLHLTVQELVQTVHLTVQELVQTAFSSTTHGCSESQFHICRAASNYGYIEVDFAVNKVGSTGELYIVFKYA